MMKIPFFCVPAISALLLVPAYSQTPAAKDDALVANEEKDTYDIANQVYQQARSTQDPAARSAAMGRAAALFGEFVRKFPKSANHNRALYLQALCQAESGAAAASNNNLAVLANKTHGEYAAAAAYKLATEAAGRQLWDKALGYYSITVRETRREDLRNDALYRQGRAQLQLGKRADAEASFRSLQVIKGVKHSIAQSALLSIAQMKTEDGQDEEAYKLFVQLLAMPALDSRVQGIATLQAARLAARLGKSRDSQDLYARLSRLPGMEKYAAEGQMETVLALFKEKKYQDVVNRVGKNYTPLEDEEKEARRALIVGQSHMEIRQYQAAMEWFRMVEEVLPASALAADAGYRRIICSQQVKGTNLFQLAERFLNTYAGAGKATAGLPCVDLVRLMYADRMMLHDAAAAARQFDALNIDHLPETVRPDAVYKKAWCAAQGDTYDPVPSLDYFINHFKEDSRMPDALALRGTVLVKQGKPAQALADFDRVIREYPQAEVIAVCWQRAAQVSATTNPQKMVEYYEGLINYYRELVKRGGKDKPAAIAEAHYNIACALYETKPADAVPHFREARTMNPEQYGSLVDLRLVHCFFKMKDAENLRVSLKALQNTNVGTYNALPPAILRWCGWMCFQARNYPDANKYLSDALVREPRENYKDASGNEKSRPRVEPLVWKTLARTRLELRLFSDALEPAQFYVSMESQPYRKAEGLRDNAQILIGLKRAEEARKLCEEAIAMGIDGPIKSTLFITLGDAFFADRQYAEAAKYYGRTANVVSDKELKPLALFKIASALNLCGKTGEAAQYEQNLKTEFPGWVPEAAALLLVEDAEKREKEAAAQPQTAPEQPASPADAQPVPAPAAQA